MAHKPADEFYAVSGNRDGLDGSCKACTRADVKRYREEHPDKITASKRAWKKTAPGKAAAKRYSQSRAGRDASIRHKHTEKGRARKRRYEHKFRVRRPDAARARDAVKRALHQGTLIRGACSMAGNGKCCGLIHGHHHRGYAEEFKLDVVWLCQAHHHLAHQLPPAK